MADRFVLPMQEEAGRSFDQYMNQEPVTSSTEAMKASFDVAMDDTAAMLWARNSAMSELEKNGQTKISADEANKRFPGMIRPFREDINPVVAQHLYDRNQEKTELQRKIQNGPNDGWAKTKNFGAGMLAHLMDPMEFGAGWIVGIGVGGLMARGAFGARAATAARAVESGTASLGTRVGVDIAESGAGNLVENTLQEVATAPTVIREGDQYDPVAGMQNIAVSTFAGTVGMTAAKVAGKAAFKGIFTSGKRLMRALRDTSPEADLMVARTAVGQLEQGIIPNAEPIVHALAKETDINLEAHPGKMSYNYAPLERGENGKEFYVVTSGEFGADGKAVGDKYTEGMQATDHPGVANAAAARATDGAQGTVWKVKASEIEPLNLNEMVPENVRPAFDAVLNKLDEKVDFDQTTGKDILDGIMAAIDEGDLEAKDLDGLTAALKEQGYNAWVHDGKTRLGYEHSPHNVLEVFDKDLLVPEGKFSPDPEVRTDPVQDQINMAEQYGSGIKNRTDIDSDLHDDFVKSLKAEDVKLTQSVAEAPERTQALVEELDALDKQGLLNDPQMKRELEAIKELQTKFEMEDLATKAMAFCVGG